MIELDRDNFEAEVLKKEGLVLVDYWSPSCEPCKALMPAVHELAEKYADKLNFASLDITKARRVAIGQRVLGLPTIILYKDGEKVEELNADTVSEAAVEEMILRHTGE